MKRLAGHLGRAAILSAAIATTAAASDITLISFGRADQAALTKAYYRPFTAATGIDVRSLSYDGQTTELELFAKTGKTAWDVIQVESRTLELGCRDGLFEKLDFGKIGSKDDFIAGAVSDCGVGIFAWGVALAYDADKVKIAPKSWADFWDLKTYPGKRGLRRSAKYTLEIALLADGVPAANVYKVLATKQGVDRAFKKLEQIKRNTVWWQAAADPALYMNDGIFAMTSAYTLWIDREQQQKRNLKIAWDGGLYDVDSWAIPKHSPKLADAYKFIAFASNPENQKALSEQLAYGPTNTKALPLLGKELAEALPSSEANRKGALKVDTAFWIRNGEALEKRFDAWAPPPCLQPTDEDEDDIDYKGHPTCQDKWGNLHSVQSKAEAEKTTSHSHHHAKPDVH